MFLKNVSFGPPFEISIEFRQKSLKNYDFCKKKIFLTILGTSPKNCPLNPMSLSPLEIWKFSELAPPGERYLAKLCCELSPFQYNQKLCKIIIGFSYLIVVSVNQCSDLLYLLLYKLSSWMLSKTKGEKQIISTKIIETEMYFNAL